MEVVKNKGSPVPQSTVILVIEAFGNPNPCELQSILLKGSYAGDFLGEYYRCY